MDSKRQKEIIIEFFAFTIFFAVVSYKLTNASLWYDETTEYWYSKYFIGTLPWQNTASNMYNHILSTAQPPLFNVLFHFWLKISESEWWMRFFGVVMGLVGALGVYKTILFGSQSHVKASISVIVYAFIYHLTYYWQEVSEYALMLGLISWTVYYFLLLIDKPDTKRIIMFVISCILSVYSQYGAIFPVMALGILAFVKILQDKNKKNITVLSGSYLIAIIFAALPLYLSFLRPQMVSRGVAEVEIKQPFSVSNFCNNFISVFKWNLFKDIGQTGEHVITAVIIILVIAAILYLIKGKKLWMKYLLVANMLCYTFYYMAVYFGFYANTTYEGQFANRYNLFLIPLWFVTTLLLIHLFLQEMLERNTFKYSRSLVAVTSGIVTALLLCWSYLGWTSIQNSWSKENIRGATEAWVDKEGYNTDTIIYRNARTGFSYYAMHNSKYEDSMLDKVVFQDSGTANVEWLDTVYEDWPFSLYIIASHISGSELNDLINVFIENGYISSDIFNSGGGRLVYLERTIKVD